MARLLRIQYPGALYHIFTRGNNKKEIFIDSNDYLLFLSIFNEVITKFGWISYAYCLMPNHYHIFIETPVENLTTGMHQLNNNYSHKFNFFHSRVGHPFQGRYKAILVEKEAYLFRLIKYIANNPVKKKLVSSPEEWPWSSYYELFKNKSISGCVDVKKVLSLFKGINNLKKLVLEGELGDDYIFNEVKCGNILGSPDFIAKFK